MLVQQPETDTFSLHGRHRRHPHIDSRTFEGQIDTTVLRKPPFCDIQSRHDLESGNHRALKSLDVLRDRNVEQDSIDSIANTKIIGQGLDMNIRGSLLKGFPDNLVNELHDTCLLILILINDTGLVPLLEVVIIKVSPLKNLFEGISSYPVEAP